MTGRKYPNAVTESVGTIHRERCSCGKPFYRVGQKYCSPACKQAAFRERHLPKDALIGCRVETPAGRGIIVLASPTAFRVAFRNNDGRSWKEFNRSEIRITSTPKPLPQWASWNGRPPRHRKGYTRAFGGKTVGDGEDNIFAASVAGESPEETPTYYTRKGSNGWGVRYARKNYTKAINSAIAGFVARAKGLTE